MKKFFVTVLCIAVAAIAGYGIKYAMTPVNTQKIEYITHENVTRAVGYIVLDEWVMTSRSEGIFYHSVEEGERVACDSVIGELFYGNVAESSIQELAVVDSKIKNASAEGSLSTAELDATTVESNIYSRENDIMTAAANDDIMSISKYKNDINSLRKNNSLSSEGTLSELQSRREQILRSISVSKEEVRAKISGVLSMYTDGFEDTLKLSDINNYSVAYLDSLPRASKTQKISTKVDVSGPVCKVVNNHLFYVMMAVPTEEMEGHRAGNSVTLRFKNMAGEMRNGIIRSVSEDQGGRVFVVVQCTSYLENAFSYRIADVDMIFDSYTGYKIPVQAIRTEDNGKQKVIGVRGNVEYDCYFDVIYTYTEGGYVIVRESESSTHKLSDMDRIVVGER